MFGFFKSDPQKKIKKQIEKKYAQSVLLQRNGKLEEYGKIMKEIERLEEELIRLQKKES
jgi:hypothetical protein